MSDYAENAIDATIAHQPSPGERFYPAFEVTPELDAAASEYVTHYPEGKQKSAVLPILHEIQKKFGFISADAVETAENAVNSSAGLGYIAAALSTGLGSIGCGIAVGSAAPAAIGAVAEEPKSFSKSLIFVALGEGVALYGFLISFIILNSL